MNVKFQKAFTLTELLIVVTVFVMVAVVAVPRHLAINSEVRAGSVSALSSHVENAARLTNRVWVAAGQPDSVVIEGRVIDMRNGFPTDQSIRDVVIDGGEFLFNDGYWKHHETARDEHCAVLYIPPSAPGGQVQVISYTDGC